MRKLLLTGGTGSLGTAYLTYGDWDGRIIVFSRDEQKQHVLRNMNLPNVRLILGDIRDRDKLRMALRDVDTVIHCAALKIIPDGGYNPDEVIKTNILGTSNVIQEAILAGVRRVLVVSTDKGVLPTTLYGATKLCAEHLAYQLNDWSRGTRVAAVRYGNVVDSRGSFTLALASWKPGDAPLRITDPNCTRFWITQRQAVALVDLALEKMEGGEVFVPKLPTKTLGEMIPEGARYEVTGLRATEKRHETLIGEHELPHTDEHATYFVVRYPPYEGRNSLTGPYCSGYDYSPSGLDTLPDEVSEVSDPTGNEPSGARLEEGK